MVVIEVSPPKLEKPKIENEKRYDVNGNCVVLPLSKAEKRSANCCLVEHFWHHPKFKPRSMNPRPCAYVVVVVFLCRNFDVYTQFPGGIDSELTENQLHDQIVHADDDC